MIEKGTVVFGNWTVEETIGSGSFGTVYKIRREDFGEEYTAAMKVIRIPQDKGEKSRLHSEGMSDEDISLYYKQIAGDFIKEIKLLSSLDGVTNIVDYKDHIIEPNEDFGYTIYIKMQLLTPVSKLLVGEGNKAKFLNSEDIIKLGKDMCSALEVCEKKRIIHRDIKIDNIFVSETGDYKLGDFGIARQLEATQGEMSKKGTLMYMAPEVFKGEKYNRTADIYSLGIVLYRLLNKNRAPFFPEYPQPIKFTDKEQANNKRLGGDLLPDIAGISVGLNAVLKKACAFNPRDRYQSAGDFRAALDSLGNETVIPVGPVPANANSDALFPEATISVNSTSAECDKTEAVINQIPVLSQKTSNASFVNEKYTHTKDQSAKDKRGTILAMIVIAIAVVVFMYLAIINAFGDLLDSSKKENIKEDVSLPTFNTNENPGTTQAFIDIDDIYDVTILGTTIPENDTSFDIPTTLPEGINVGDQDINSGNTGKTSNGGIYRITTQSDHLTIRLNPSTSSSAVDGIASGTEVEVLGIYTDSNGNKFGFVIVGGSSGWINMKYTEFVSASTNKTTHGIGKYVVNYYEWELPLRRRPDDSNYSTSIPNGTEVTVISVYQGISGEWGLVEFNGEVGWIPFTFLD